MKEARTYRTYDSRLRQDAAREKRALVLTSARLRFLKLGYASTTMADIARDAGVALDTVYAAVGKKPKLFRLLVETAISGQDEALPADERNYVQAIRAEPDAARKLRIYAGALRSIQPRLAPLFKVLQAAAPTDRGLKALWQEIAERRASNMRLLAQDLQKTGRLRADLSVSMVADIIWSMNSPEYYLLLVQERGWSPEAFEQWLGDAWIRLLIEG